MMLRVSDPSKARIKVAITGATQDENVQFKVYILLWELAKTQGHVRLTAFGLSKHRRTRTWTSNFLRGTISWRSRTRESCSLSTKAWASSAGVTLPRIPGRCRCRVGVGHKFGFVMSSTDSLINLSLTRCLVNCWPSPTGEGTCDVTIEYELENKRMELKDVIISIPFPWVPFFCRASLIFLHILTIRLL